MFISNNFLKLFYNFMLSGMPIVLNNPINKNILHAPFLVDSHSTYINYRLNDEQYNTINNNLKKYNNFDMSTTSIASKTNKEYFLSINIYNCTSPIFDYIDNDSSTRCELNTYVIDKKNNLKGTLIMDYVSSMLSLDPDNLFKKKGIINFKKNNNKIMGYAINNNFNLEFEYDHSKNIKKNKLSSSLIKFTDVIYYNCGLYDKLYYDSSLTQNNIITCLNNNVNFKFLNIDFKEVDSVFYFENKINFIGGLWKNIF